MAYTGYGYNIEIRNLEALYASWIDQDLAAGGLRIMDRIHFGGFVEFEWKTFTAFWATYGFYLEMGVASCNQYTFFSEMLHAQADWTHAYQTMPWAWFTSYGLGHGRTIDTMKEVWLGRIDLGMPIWVDDWVTGKGEGDAGRKLMVCRYGIYWDYDIGTWVNVRTGDRMPQALFAVNTGNWNTELDWLNQFVHWSIGRNITYDEWWQGGIIAPWEGRVREEIAKRCGIIFLSGTPSYWSDTKTGDKIIAVGDWDAELNFLNTHQVVIDMRIAYDGDADVYVNIAELLDISRPESSYR